MMTIYGVRVKILTEVRGQSKKFARNVGVRVKILTNFLL